MIIAGQDRRKEGTIETKDPKILEEKAKDKQTDGNSPAFAQLPSTDAFHLQS